MMHRRELLKMMATAGYFCATQPLLAAPPGRVRVTLVRWPYT